MTPTSDDGKPQRKAASAVDQALLAVRLLVEQPEVRIDEVCDRLDVRDATGRRVMAILVRHGFVTHDESTDAYRSWFGSLPALATDAPVVERLVEHARQSLDFLARETGETIHLGVRDGVGVRFVDVIESNHPLRVSGRVGRLIPMHATSMGKAMLGTMSDAQIAALLPAAGLPRLMPRTKTTRTALMREIVKIRNQGYAVNREESELGVGSVGVAVVTPTRGLVAALSISAPVDRMSDRILERHAALLLQQRNALVDRLVGQSSAT